MNFLFNFNTFSKLFIHFLPIIYNTKRIFSALISGWICPNFISLWYLILSWKYISFASTQFWLYLILIFASLFFFLIISILLLLFRYIFVSFFTKHLYKMRATLYYLKLQWLKYLKLYSLMLDIKLYFILFLLTMN